MISAPAGGFLTTGPPRKSSQCSFICINISLMMNEFEHLNIVMATCASHILKLQFKAVVHFFYEIAFLFICENSLCILEMSLCRMCV